MQKNTNVNHQIKFHSVLLIDENGSNLGNVPLKEALSRAFSLGLDLVEVSKNDKGIPICKIMDHGKWKYEQTKKVKKNTTQRQQQTKEIKFRPNTGVNDLVYRAKHVEEFLKEGNRVKLLVRFKGREQEHMFITGKNLLDKFLNMINGPYSIFDPAKVEDNSISLILFPSEPK